jgi:cation-transporting ATPase E
MASGAQAASQVAQLVLLNNDFSAMPGIVGEGRRVINNIQRAAALFLVKNIFSLGLSVITLFTDWPYPLIPLHMSLIAALTIGVPSFFLAMEPNYERVTGHFIRGVLRRAFPGGLTNIFVVLMAQAFRATFGLTAEQTATICAALLGAVGLQVLFQTCKPFDKFRKLIWAAMALALVCCFSVLSPFFELGGYSRESGLVMAALIIMSPTVFFAIQRIFDQGDKVYLWIRTKMLKKTEA